VALQVLSAARSGFTRVMAAPLTAGPSFVGSGCAGHATTNTVFHRVVREPFRPFVVQGAIPQSADAKCRQPVRNRQFFLIPQRQARFRAAGRSQLKRRGRNPLRPGVNQSPLRLGQLRLQHENAERSPWPASLIPIGQRPVLYRAPRSKPLVELDGRLMPVFRPCGQGLEWWTRSPGADKLVKATVLEGGVLVEASPERAQPQPAPLAWTR